VSEREVDRGGVDGDVMCVCVVCVSTCTAGERDPSPCAPGRSS
jgi:hypothetical protein